jgi:hypothetical protein
MAGTTLSACNEQADNQENAGAAPNGSAASWFAVAVAAP